MQPDPLNVLFILADQFRHDCMGVETPDRFQGRSLLGRVRGQADAALEEEVFYEKDYRAGLKKRPGADPDRCLLWVVRDDAYKLVHFADPSVPPLLYDLRRDPGEQHSLAEDASHVGVLLTYSQRLLRWRMRHEDQRMEHWAWALRQG